MAQRGESTTSRRVYRLGHSHVVALPAWVREHLRVGAGDAVYWFAPQPDEAVLCRRKQRPGGRPIGARAERELEMARQEVERLRRKLTERPARVHNQGANAGYMMALRQLGPVAERLDRIEKLLHELDARGVRPRSRRGYKLPRGVVAIDVPLPDAGDPVDDNPTPTAPPSS